MTQDAQAAAAYRAIASLQRLADVFARRRRQLAASVGLTESQWRVLEEIGGDGFLPSLFARRQEVTPAAVSRTLKQLLELGHVRSAISDVDGRQRIYRLTSTGREILDRVEEARQEAVVQVWSCLPTSKLRSFGDVADDLTQRLEDLADND